MFRNNQRVVGPLQDASQHVRRRCQTEIRIRCGGAVGRLIPRPAPPTPTTTTTAASPLVEPLLLRASYCCRMLLPRVAPWHFCCERGGGVPAPPSPIGCHELDPASVSSAL